MSDVPSLSFHQIINALQRGGFVVVRQRGSHIRLQKRLEKRTIRVTVPAHRPVKKSTLPHIIKDAGLTLADFLKLL
jgi:predicted RNA binding protein YcfA (HicA-like mRNA interferase family)